QPPADVRVLLPLPRRLRQPGQRPQRLGRLQLLELEFGTLEQLRKRAMKKILCNERPDWRQTAEKLGFLFHT
uniref:hypothetical protein n=1 Tax=Pseudomonas chlororaphis TaxID=587753 RepID=UPI0021822634